MSTPFRIVQGGIPEQAWTERVSNNCAICGGICDREEFADLEHDEDCLGCPICEIAIRLFKELPDGRVLGVAMHPGCFESILQGREGQSPGSNQQAPPGA